MKIDVSKKILGLSGEDIPSSADKPDAPPLTLAIVFTNALLAAPPQQGIPYAPEQTVARYGLALTIRDALKDDEPEIDITADMAVLLKADVNRCYGPIVAGQVLPLLDGK